jgi:hypothetical protein
MSGLLVRPQAPWALRRVPPFASAAQHIPASPAIKTSNAREHGAFSPGKRWSWEELVAFVPSSGS